jgi:hypothetical protein
MGRRSGPKAWGPWTWVYNVQPDLHCNPRLGILSSIRKMMGPPHLNAARSGRYTNSIPLRLCVCARFEFSKIDLPANMLLFAPISRKDQTQIASTQRETCSRHIPELNSCYRYKSSDISKHSVNCLPINTALRYLNRCIISINFSNIAERSTLRRRIAH